MAVPLIDLARIHKPYREEMSEIFENAVNTNDFILGPTLTTFEQNFAKAMNCRHALGVASGTDALMLSLHAVGVGPGDEVICPAFGFVATADVILRLGATVVFVDIGEDFNMDPAAVRAAITDNTKAIIAVHLYGQACDLAQLTQIAADYGIYLIEDVAQAAGAEYGERKLGTFGIAGCFSFYPTKNLGGLGDGGMIITDSDELAERVRLFRNHGHESGDLYLAVGYNSRLDSIQAGVLDLKLPNLSEDVADRIANASFYETNLTKEFFTLPAYIDDGSHSYNLYTIRTPQRDALQTFLAERHIDSRVYYSKPLHLQPCFELLGYSEGHFPVSEQVAQEALSIPVFPGLTRQELDEVVHMIELFAKTHPVTAAS